MKKADNGNRTRLSGLGSRRSTDEPYLQKEHKILYSMFLYFASPNFYYFYHSNYPALPTTSERSKCRLYPRPW